MLDSFLRAGTADAAARRGVLRQARRTARPEVEVATICGGGPFAGLAGLAGCTTPATAADFFAADAAPPPGVPPARPGLRLRRQQLDAQQRAMPHERAGSVWRALADLPRLLFDSGIEAGCFFAANAIALTAQARVREGSLGAWTGWEPRRPDEAETYADGLREAVVAAATVAAPVALVLLLARWAIQPVAAALGQALLGPHGCSATPPEVFHPNPSRLHADGRLLTRAELRSAWQAVRRGRIAVARRQRQFEHGRLRSLACEMAHPLAFALQGLALDFRLQRPGILTAGGITLGTAALAATLSDAGLHALKMSARMRGTGAGGRPVSLHLFDAGHGDAGASLARRLRKVAGGATGPRGMALAMAADLLRCLLAVLALDASAALVDSLDAQFNRTPDQRLRAEVNLGFSLLSNALAMLGFRLAARASRGCLACGDRP
ncbi:hypothetical protein GT347_19220 [Xylophilus rhododendri]|uniref:Uncharacterized protein n=1 Tax=Xylophilus rhododendri TaxID=2697032 RepID=A0A857J7H1_9BURK|nr:hypothetical protein [Xylophilus rhododendri]QHI99924.1 hypothetical protein GT347_19220 [Xylophilus rhododendri]